MAFLRKNSAFLPIIAVVLVAAAGLGYVKRHEIRDAFFRMEQGPIPEPISREELIINDGDVPMNEQIAPPEKPTEESANVNVPPPKPPAAPPSPAPAPAPAPAPTSPTAPLRDSLNLSVLFIPQAPTQVWDHMHEEACEEAAMAMINAYIEDRTSMTVDQMEAELQAIVDYEMKTLGYFESTDAPTTAAVMRGFYGLKTVRVVPLTSLDQVKEQIAAGRPVMLPTAGRELKNPYFSGIGPIYHMVVAKGYTRDRIITNDPGTKRGADYTYANDVLWNAIGEWTGSGMDTSKKFMIYVE